MRQYELTYLISDEVKESELNKVTGKIGGLISGLDGKTIKEEIWKRRKLAYPIKKQEFAIYVTIILELPREKTKEFERDLSHFSSVLRHLLIIKDEGNQKLTLTADEIVGTEDIESVAGGQNSFEAIEGETEESKDLMAKRKEEEAKQEEETKEEKKSEKAEERPVKAAKPEKKKVETKENEADRLAKLDKELDELLKEDL